MHILSAILFVTSSSIDNLVVGIAYGAKQLKIPFVNNIIIALISLCGTLVSMLLGKFIYYLLSVHIANIIGSVILIVLGIWFIIKSFLDDSKNGKSFNDDSMSDLVSYEKILKNPEKADSDNSGSIDSKESLTLGFALSLNNIGLGIAASIAGLNILLTSILTLIFSLTTIPLGYYIGTKFFSKFFGRYGTTISGIIIVLLGIYELFI